MNMRPDPTTFLPMTRALRVHLEATIEQLVALLDEIDGDPDLEPSVDDEDGGDAKPDVDSEPSLGALNDHLHQGAWGYAGYVGDGDELEDDAIDLPA